MSQHPFLYTLRSLTEADIPTWADFCASCFSYKPNPPAAEYFSDHFFNDPRRDAKLLCVIKATNAAAAVDKSECDDNGEEGHARIVASTRIFSRKISLGNGKTVEAGGVGEVCTDISHRSKGLAKTLLMDRIELMRQMKITCSLLHASPALMNVYERSAEYKSVDSYWKVLAFARDNIMIGQGCVHAVPRGMEVRLASFPNDTCQLQKIHRKYSEDRFAGCIIRSVDYWNEYISNEIGDSLFVLHTKENKIIAWMAIRKRSNKRFQLRDFGCCREACAETSVTISIAFSILAKITLKIYSSDDLEQDLEFSIPLGVYKDLESGEMCNGNSKFLEWAESVSDECDCGWMYKNLESVCDYGGANNDKAEAGVDMPHIVNEMKTPHLIWPVDSF